MKRLLLPIFLAFFVLINSAILKAQPTLTAANTNVIVGEKFISNHVGGSAAPFNAGLPAGANQIWNFGNLTSIFYPTISILFQPPLVIGSNSYPAANIVIGRDGEYEYFKTNNDSVALVGYYDNYTEETVDYSNSVKKLQYPFTYNSFLMDNFTGVGDGMGPPVNLGGYITVAGDGYGSLILPNGTVNNVLRVKSVKVTTTNSSVDTVTTLDWYLPGVHVPILKLSKLQFFALNYSATYYQGYYINPFALSLKEDLATQLNLQTFPNPTTTEVTIQFTLDAPSKVTLTISDALGREVIRKEQAKQPAGNKTQTLDVSKLPKGVYLVHLENETGVEAKRLLIQ